MLYYQGDRKYIIQYSPNTGNYIKFGPYNEGMLPEIKNNDGTERNHKSIPQPKEQVLYNYPELKNTFVKFTEQKFQNLQLKDIKQDSTVKAEWQCKKCGHKWEAIVRQRTREKTQCPFCCKMNISFPEKYIFYSLKQVDPDLQENYKLPGMHGIELDMYNPHKNYAIEFSQQFFHSERIDPDEEKYQFCMNNRIRLIQIYQVHSEKQVRKINDDEYIIPAKSSINGIQYLDIIINDICKQLGLSMSLIDRQLASNQAFIRTNKIPPEGESLKDLYPDLCRDWDYNKNGVIKPEMLKPAQHVKVWLKCIYCGREWITQPASRTDPNTNRKAGCRFCRIKIYNGLMQEIPYIPDNKV